MRAARALDRYTLSFPDAVIAGIIERETGVGALLAACKAALPHMRQLVAAGQVEGEDTSHYSDARAVKALESALAQAEQQK